MVEVEEEKEEVEEEEEEEGGEGEGGGGDLRQSALLAVRSRKNINAHRHLVRLMSLHRPVHTVVYSSLLPCRCFRSLFC